MTTDLDNAFAALRCELGIAEAFPPEVERAAADAAARGPRGERVDRRGLPFLTIDPPGARDLDQALCLLPRGRGARLYYAIADVDAFVDPGDPVDREAWRRGVTFYAPDRVVPLYPSVLSEEAASLRPGVVRPAVVFVVDLDPRAEPVALRLERAWVESRAQLSFGEALAWVRNPPAQADPALVGVLRLLQRVGEERRQRELERGGASLTLRDQHVQARAAATLGDEVVFEEPNEVERWNEQISLLAGHVAARRMLAAGVGLLRVQPPPSREALAKARRLARSLGLPWPRGWSYAQFLHHLDPRHPKATALVWQLRHWWPPARYVAFVGRPPRQPLHAALAMPYAHVTAPLRRLADRYVHRLLLALEVGRRPEAALLRALRRLPRVMEAAQHRERTLERRIVDLAEAWMVRDRVGEVFPAVVLECRPDAVELEIVDPPIRAEAPPPDGVVPRPGTRVRARLVRVDTLRGRLEFAIERSTEG